MIDGWALWLLIVGLALGAAGATLLLVRLPRQDDDVGPAERQNEAAWIGATIERHGGVAPPSLVEEVLELHDAYLAAPRPPVPSGGGTTPVPPPPLAPPPAPPGYAAPPATPLPPPTPPAAPGPPGQPPRP